MGSKTRSLKDSIVSILHAPGVLESTHSERGFSAPLTRRCYHIGRNFWIHNSTSIRFFEGSRMAGECGSNVAMEASFTTDSFKVDQVDSEVDSNKATDATPSLPGFLCNSVTTVGKSTNIVWQECMVKKEERQKLLGQKGCVIWITGLSGSGKSTLACTLDHALLKRGNLSYIIDGDNLRHGLNNNLGFCAEDRTENIRRVGEVGKLFADAGVICIASVISPYRKDRDACRQLVPPGEFIEVHMNFPVSLCEERDPKGLYKLARAGKIKGFTGVDDPYEAPVNCEVVMQQINGRCPTPAEMACQLITYLEERKILGRPRQKL
ncbi:hypothetical protein GOP47_0018793 [Adiantum capillus-veneris]|uniref:Adenylyl-sulfate kinase n=1 Tax=Adiantum capillus-veneris TaxID=13818 RepID=A0A9D4UDV5_ADICA|nr:hypothetical protein GOP47_0018793 [Adiantum capillus-veneris]